MIRNRGGFRDQDQKIELAYQYLVVQDFADQLGGEPYIHDGGIYPTEQFHQGGSRLWGRNLPIHHSYRTESGAAYYRCTIYATVFRSLAKGKHHDINRL